MKHKNLIVYAFQGYSRRSAQQPRPIRKIVFPFSGQVRRPRLLAEFHRAATANQKEEKIAPVPNRSNPGTVGKMGTKPGTGPTSESQGPENTSQAGYYSRLLEQM